MAWTANLKSAETINGVARITITFLNDKDATRNFDKTYQIGSPGNDFVKNQAIQEVRNLQTLDDYVSGLTIGGDIDLTPKAPTIDESAANDFFSKLAKLNNLQSSLAKGLIKIDDQGLLGLTADVKSILSSHPEYTTDFRWR